MPTGRADAFAIPVGGSVYAGIGPAITPPSTATLSGPTSATSGGAVTYTVTLDRAADQTYTITPAASDSGELSPTSATIAAGGTSATFAVTWPAAGTGRTVDFTVSPSLARAGRPISVTVSAPITAGAWQQLSVAPHARRLFYGTTGNIPTGTTFDPTVSATVDTLGTSSVSAIPYRSFTRPVMGEPGVLYYMGGLHSNYYGNEIDRIDLRNLASTQLTTTLNQQPRVPPQGPESGYGTGISGYVYRQYGTPLTDTSQWEPYSHHSWTFNGWHPAWGYFTQVRGAQGDGATLGANPGGSGTQYQQATPGGALITYEWTEAKWRLRVNSAVYADFDETNGPGPSGASDWNQHTMSLVFMNNRSGTTFVREVINTQSTAVEVFNFSQATLAGSTWGWADRQSGNGILIKWLEGSKYLCLRSDFNKFSGDPNEAYTTIFLMNLVDPVSKVRKLTPPAGAVAGVNWQGDGNITFAVDRSSRRVFWWVVEGNVTVGATQFQRFFVSTFDDLMTWTAISTTGLPTITHTSANFAAIPFADKRERMWFYNGHLFIVLPGTGGGPNDPGYQNGAANWWRVKVDSGAALPTMNFARFDYWAQSPATNGFRFSNTSVANLQMIGTKHVNWAWDPVRAKFFQHAGDFGMSTCQSMCTLVFDGTARGYTFTEILNEDSNPPAGKVRPSSPDDGHWCYIPTDSAWVAGRGKFLFVRGGDGEPMFYNAVLRAKYGSSDSNGTIGQVQTALSEGWDLASKYYLFDPDTTSFDPVGASFTFNTFGNPSSASATLGAFEVSSTNGWTQDNGSTFVPSVWTMSSVSSRCGTFDPSTSCLWRFYSVSGSMFLARFDFTAKTVRLFNCATWTSPETSRVYSLDGSQPATEAEVVADGSKPLFGWYDSANSRWKTGAQFHQEHKALWIDPATGYLYVVSPFTGYLWRFDTRATPTNPDGYKIPFGPIGARVPLVGTFPLLNSRTTWPPVVYTDTGNVRLLNSMLMPFKGGLLYLSWNHHDSGYSGEPHYALWRALGDTGPWSVVTMPQEFAANSFAATSQYDINNSELMLISQAFTDIETRQFYRYFWRLT